MVAFAYYRDDSSSLPYIIGAVVTFFIFAWIWGAIESYVQKRVKEIADRTIAARKVEVDNHTIERNKEIDQHQKEALLVIYKKQEMLGKARTEFDSSYIVGRRWLARLISESESTFDNRLENHLRTKSHPALKAAEEVKLANQKKRDAIAKLKFLEYQLATYKEYFPVLEEYEAIILDEVAGFKRGDDIDDPDENIDRAYLYLSKEEYQKLPPSERNQRALDVYKSRNKSSWEIGRFYERYLGYIYEMDGWDVNFQGIHKGFEDMGRDLICTKNSEIHIIQAKCWSQDKVIHEKHLFQLFGSCLEYQFEKQKPAIPIFATTTQLSAIAVEAARRLNVTVWNQKLDRDYPLIKCNINQGNRIYHLPFDQQYDRTKIRPSEDEFYALTVADAEAKEFRRAMRHRFQAPNA